ncbi:MAG: lactonase family protein [Chloroflexi bacterium]|nr:lactonase family protein [Chloroflexota bacterium]
MSQYDKQIVFASGYATAAEPGIRAYAFDTAQGTLSARGAFSGIINPSYIIPHPNGRWLYATSETSATADGMPGSVWALRTERDAAGNVTFSVLNRQPCGGEVTCHAIFDATHRWLIVSNYGTGSAAVLPVQADGSLGAMSAHVQHSGHGPNASRQAGPHAHSAIVSPDNRFVIVADLGIDRLMIYRFDADSGSLASHGEMAARSGAGPRHMAFHPGGRVLYVANELGSTLGVYTYDPADGTLKEIQNLDTLPANAPENIVAHVAINGQRVVVSNRGHNSLAVFEMSADGLLNRAAIADCGGNWPRNFAFAPGGQFVLVANQYSGEICVLPVSNGPPVIGEPVARESFPQVSCVQFTPSTVPTR